MESPKESLEVRQAKQEVKIDVLGRDISQVDLKVSNLDAKTSAGLNSIETKLDMFIANLDKRYASKLTEKIVNAMVGFILITVLGALMFLILPRMR